MVTNYCGLFLKLIYEESPNLFQELISALVFPEGGLVIGPVITQQERESKSIPDLLIKQSSFSIFFETKLEDWHYTEQISRHIQSHSEENAVKILFLMSNYECNNYEEKYKIGIEKGKNQGVIVKPISFEDFAICLNDVCKTEYLKNLLEEFKIFLDQEKLLPRWKYLLDVVNSATTINEIYDHGVYICPSVGRPYKHTRAKFFGPYVNKQVKKIYEIRGVVFVNIDKETAEVKLKNVNVAEKKLEKEAIDKVKEVRSQETSTNPWQVFLLENEADTNFEKDSKGGLFGSKKYFWEIARDCKTSQDLAKKLLNKKWSNFE